MTTIGNIWPHRPHTYGICGRCGRHMRHTGHICGRCGRCGHSLGVGFGCSLRRRSIRPVDAVSLSRPRVYPLLT
jgi:predicted amidophosphoribosyltransferase